MAVHRYVVADVFTDTPLAGNQLAVFTDATGIPEAQLQPLARELALSETVFVYRPSAGGTVRARIFTPAGEIPFAGHPVLGTAFVLAAPLQLGVIVVETGSGLVPVTLERDPSGRVVFGWMEQPVPVIAPAASPGVLFAALGVEQAALPVEVYDNGLRHTLVLLRAPEVVSALTPDFRALLATGVQCVSCFAGVGGRWTTRMFAPGLGFDEDAATGSAAGPLVCHLGRHGLVPWGTEIEISQGAAIGRPSTLFARAEGHDASVERVEVGGTAVVVARGEFRL